ncbi:nucleotidyltransferase family protein [Palaeococcus ferrophilus]|uniref:nucleotidyltransferase family protein n=1 Tax=Palaeococcus ferrophilus TaxID=83868 RepID=UPI00064FBDA6|nr:nucleotidyltransferase family protein [Palaeococcus ferrophilus]
MKALPEIISILKDHRRELEEKYGVIDIEIFGSYAREEAGESSDVDILVEFKEPVGLLTIAKLQTELSDLLGVKVDLIPKKSLRKELWESVSKEAIKI